MSDVGGDEEAKRFVFGRNIVKWYYLILLVLYCLVINPSGGFSQTTPTLPPGVPTPPVIDPTGRSGEPRLGQEEEEKPSTGQTGDVLSEPPSTLGAEGESASLLRVVVNEIQVTGSTVFSPEELSEVAQPYVGKELTTEKLEDLRKALTALYTDKGYINSGAYIPDQEIKDGVLTIHLIEGVLSDIKIEGTDHYFPSYFSSRINQSAGPPLKIEPLQDRLQQFLEDDRIARVNSELQPGLRPGEANLLVQVEEARPYHAYLEFNNYQSPTVGAERGLGTFVHRNLLGLGDPFSFTYGRSEGVDPLIDVSYQLPFTPWDTTLIFGYRKNNFEVIEAPFDVLDINSKSNSYIIGLRQPIYRRVGQELAFTVTGEYQENKTVLLGIPFSFTPGTTNGVSNVAALRFGQEWLDRRPGQVFALRSRISVGIDVFDATINHNEVIVPNLGTVPSGQFLSWLGQVQYAKQFEFLDIQLLSRADLQLSKDRLFPLEQFPVGGRFSVRGYRENTLVRDNAFLFSLEGRLPLWQSQNRESSLQIAPFVDVGRAWLSEASTPSPETLASVGVGLRLEMWQRIQANIYWGQQLNHVPDQGNNLQDHGVHVQVVVQPF